MAQQSARRDRENQRPTPYLEYATVIWTRSANSHAGQQLMAAVQAGQMAASDHASRQSRRFPLPTRGRPQMLHWWPMGVRKSQAQPIATAIRKGSGLSPSLEARP